MGLDGAVSVCAHVRPSWVLLLADFNVQSRWFVGWERLLCASCCLDCSSVSDGGSQLWVTVSCKLHALEA